MAVAIALFAGPTGTRVLPEGVGSAEAYLLKSCNPDNQYVHNPGPAFKSFGSGTARFWESEVDGTSISGDYVGGRIVWSFLQVATQDSSSLLVNDPYPGDVFGFLVATVTWDNGQVAKFIPKCLAEVITKGGSRREAEVTAEGWVTGFPTDTSTQSAVGLLKMTRDTNTRKVQVKFILYLGSRCQGGSQKEFTVGADSIEPADPDEGGFLANLKETGRAAGVLKSPDSTAGVDILPGSLTPNDCTEVAEEVQV